MSTNLKKIAAVAVALAGFRFGTAWADLSALPGYRECGIDLSESALSSMPLASRDDDGNLSGRSTTKFAYCSCGVSLSNNPSKFTKEDEIMDWSDASAAKCVSDVERQVLEAKRGVLLEAEYSRTGSAFSGDGKRLSFAENRRLSENQAGLDCGGLEKGDSDIVSCIKDLRRYEYQLRQEAWILWSAGVKWNVSAQSATNWAIAATDQFIGFFAFGFRKFDRLPPLGYERGDIFARWTVVGFINTSALALIAAFILWFLFEKAHGRRTEGYGVFSTKIVVVLLLTIGFPTLYLSIDRVNGGMGAAMLNSMSEAGITSLRAQDLSMDSFGSGGFNRLSSWFIFTVINVFLLLVISIVILIRNYFLYFIGYLFFPLSLGLLAAAVRGGDFMEGSRFQDKANRFMVHGLYYSISAFVSVVISVFLFKAGTVVMSTIPAPENSEIKMVEALSSFSLSAFFYLLFLGFVIWLWKYKIHPAVGALVAKFFNRVFFPDAGNFSPSDFVSALWRGYSAVRDEYDHLSENDPRFIGLSRNVWKVSSSFSEALASVPYASKAAQALSKETGIVRRLWRTALSLGTAGAVESAALLEDDVSVGNRWTLSKGERTRALERLSQQISAAESEGSETGATKARLLKERRDKIITDAADEVSEKRISELSKSADGLREFADKKPAHSPDRKLALAELENVLVGQRDEIDSVLARDRETRTAELRNEVRKLEILAASGGIDAAERVRIGEEIARGKIELGSLAESPASGNGNSGGVDSARVAAVASKDAETAVNAAAAKAAADVASANQAIAWLDEKRAAVVGTSKEAVETRSGIDQQKAVLNDFIDSRKAAAEANAGSPRHSAAEAVPDTDTGLAPETVAAREVAWIPGRAEPAEPDPFDGFAAAYAQYSAAVGGGGDEDDVRAFGDDPLAGKIIAEHFAETGDVVGIGRKIREFFENRTRNSPGTQENGPVGDASEVTA